MEIKDPIFAQLEKKIIIYKLLAGEFRMNQIFVNISFFFFDKNKDLQFWKIQQF